MYSYVISEYSTRFLPTAAHAGYQQVVPAGDFSLICTFSSTHHAKKLISISECWMVIGWCKKISQGAASRLSYGPYISCCSHQNQHSVPCFGGDNPVAPSLGLVSRTSLLAMASEGVPPVIDLLEEEEEEWPDAGAQNPEEAQKYIDRINGIFDHLSKLIHEDKKDALETTIQNFKKWIVKQWVMMGDVDVDVVLHTIRDPTTVYLCQHLTKGGVDVFDPPEDILSGRKFICPVT